MHSKVMLALLNISDLKGQFIYMYMLEDTFFAVVPNFGAAALIKFSSYMLIYIIFVLLHLKIADFFCLCRT